MTQVHVYPPRSPIPPRHARSLRGHALPSLRRGTKGTVTAWAPPDVSPRTPRASPLQVPGKNGFTEPAVNGKTRSFSNGQPCSRGPRRTRPSGSRPRSRSPCPHVLRYNRQRAKKKKKKKKQLRHFTAPNGGEGTRRRHAGPRRRHALPASPHGAPAARPAAATSRPRASKCCGGHARARARGSTATRHPLRLSAERGRPRSKCSFSTTQRLKTPF